MKTAHITKSRKRVAKAYASHDPESLIIRDLLALDRTILANERTLLAYIRTAFVLAGSGLTLIKLLPELQAFRTLGYALIPVSILVLFYGLRRYIRTRNALLKLSLDPE